MWFYEPGFNGQTDPVVMERTPSRRRNEPDSYVAAIFTRGLRDAEVRVSRARGGGWTVAFVAEGKPGYAFAEPTLRAALARVARIAWLERQ